MQREERTRNDETQTNVSWASGDSYYTNRSAPWPANAVDTGILPQQSHQANEYNRQQYEDNVEGYGHFNSYGDYYSDYYANNYGEYNCGYDDYETYEDEGYGYYNSYGYYTDHYSNYDGENSCGYYTYGGDYYYGNGGEYRYEGYGNDENYHQYNYWHEEELDEMPMDG